jgi:hypothetical protein
MASSPSRFRPVVREVSGGNFHLLKWSVVFITLLFLSVPTPDQVIVQPMMPQDAISIQDQFDVASNFIGVKLPYPVFSIAPGEIPIGTGFAYIHDETIRFKDPINQLNDSETIGPGDVLHETLIGDDIDNDGYTEFLFMMFNYTSLMFDLVIVDFDASSVIGYDCLIPGPFEILLGNFTPDAQTDAAIYGNDIVLIKDLSDGSDFGFYNPVADITRACVGNFTATPQHEIAVLSTDWGTQKVNLAIISGDGTEIKWIEHTDKSQANDIVKVSRRLFLDDIAITLFNQGLFSSELIGIFGNNLTPIFSIKIPEYQGFSFVKTGHFNDDMREDIVVVPGEWYSAWYYDGFDGKLLQHSQEPCMGYSRHGFDTALLDSDSYSDLAIEGPRGQLALIRGSTGEIGYEEHRMPGPFYQVSTFDIDQDDREDIITVMDDVSILLSDTETPNVELDPLYPTHPTIYDTYMKIELTATDNIYVKRATIFIKPTGGITTPFLSNEMIRAPNDKFIYITTDLQAGDYLYYIEVRDPYLNSFSYGNETHPETLTVDDHFVDGVYHNATIYEAMGHVLAMGNSSAGEELIHILTIDDKDSTATMRTLSPDGTAISDFTLRGITTLDTFEVYCGMFDGDAVLDPVIASYNRTHTVFYVIHGDDLTSWQNVSYKEPPAMVHGALSIFDDDQDGFDEIHYVQGNYSAYALTRVEHDFSSSINDYLSDNGEVVEIAYATISGSRPQLGLLRENNTVDIYQAYNVTLLKTLSYSSPGSTQGDVPLGIVSYSNTSHVSEQFLVGYSGWSGDTPLIYLCLVDDQTLQVGDAPYTELLGDHIKGLYTHDIDIDGIDELFIFEESGNVSLCDLGYATPRQWSVFVSEAFPTSTVLLDYDGDGADEFLISTSDDMLTAINFQGGIDYQAQVGMIFNMARVSGVDVGVGEDIAAFPIFRARYSLATIRNIDLLYMLNVTFDLETSLTLQGSSLWANATVLNVYNEPVNDASASIVVSYRFGAGISEQTLGMVYDDIAQFYTTTVAPNWPMGMANLSLTVSHSYYDGVSYDYVNALRVESPLSITLFADSEVMQGNDLDINITVTDSLGAKVIDADVNVTLDGEDYAVSYVGGSYYTSVSEITLAPGSYAVFASADHEYATNGTGHSRSVSVIANLLNITRNSPLQTLQDQFFTTWLNITDLYGNPIDGATVSVDFGVIEFTLLEMAPGRYLLDSLAAMPVGNYTVDIIIQHPYVEGTVFGQYHMAVTGTLAPAVAYESDVEGGKNFTLSIFVYDLYGVRPEGAWVEVELNGVNYTATHIEGAEFRVELNASLSIGQHSFVVYVGATFGEPRADAHDLFVYSFSDTLVESSIGWTLIQGNLTWLTVTVADWQGTPVVDATVTMLSPESILFTPGGDGTYWADLDTTGYVPANYSLLILVEHTYLFTYDSYQILTVNGQAVVDVFVSDIVFNHQMVRFDFVVVDIYGNPLYDFDYSFDFAGTFTKSGTSFSYEVSWEFQPDLYPGAYQLNMTVDGPFLSQSEFMIWVDVIGNTSSTVPSPLDQSIFLQGNEINFTIVVKDLAGYSISGAQVTATIHGSMYTLAEGVVGVYSRQVPTAGLPLGQYNVTLGISHAFSRTICQGLC